MAFDINNPAHLTALKNEVLTDPVGMGYNPADTSDVLSKLNLPTNNVVGDVGPDYVTPENLLDAIWGEAISSQDQFKVDLLFSSVSSLDADISRFKDRLSNLSASIATAVAGITRVLSRAEVLFASLDENGVTEKVFISRIDWFAARDS